MKRFLIIKSSLYLFTLMIIFACSKNETNDIVKEEIPKEVANLLNTAIILSGNRATLSWNTTQDPYIQKVEVSYEPSNGEGLKNVVLVDVNPGSRGSYSISLDNPYNYTFSLVALNKGGFRSEKVHLNLTGQTNSRWVARADTLIKALVKYYLDGKARDIWTNTYPQSAGYWDGAAVIWGHGAAFSGYTAFKEATWDIQEYKNQVITRYDNRLLVGIDQFRNKRNGGPEAYAVYPGDGDERYYDDNIWVGIDMAKLYVLTNDNKYLTRAKLVWDFVLSGADDKMGGGVYWKEGLTSKHTCSTFPAAVLGLLLYKATNENHYLEQAKQWYVWGKQLLQDPQDNLFWDNVKLKDDNNPNSEIIVEKNKYSYNTGQPMQVAALLYTITNDNKYLEDAKKMAKAAFQHWFVPFHSYLLKKHIYILDPGHVWFQAIMMRGFIELYKIDKDRTYIDAYENTLLHAWLSDARNKATNLINNNFWGNNSQNSWEVLHQGAVLEMISNLAALDK